MTSPTKRDDPGERHRDGREQRAMTDEHEPQPLDVDAQVARGALAERQQVERAAVHTPRWPARRRTHGSTASDGRPGGPVEAAELPERHGAQRVVVRDERQHRRSRAARPR